MARTFEFHGGVYPPERKQRSLVPVRHATPPSRVVLPLDQHAGRPARAIVAVGDRVHVGTPIARRDGMISADLHASISGTVTHSDALAITIEGDGHDIWQRLPPLDWRSVSAEPLLTRLEQSGVVGLGGAGFPTHIKARLGEQQRIDTLVVNAAECEPYITVDDLTLQHFADDVLDGAQLIASLCDARQIVVGIEDNKPEAIQALEHAMATSHPRPVSLSVIATRYPSGGERQLIKALLDRDVPHQGLPADVGVLCHNPGTLLAVLRAVRDGEPLVERLVTLTGDALDDPGNRWVRIGTPIATLLEEAGLQRATLDQLIEGGPMMGTPLADLDGVIRKATNCLIAATRQELPPSPPESPCIRCGACEDVCPAHLLPQQLHWYARAKDDDKLAHYRLFDCIECNACSYVCPSHIPLVADYRSAKTRLRHQRLEAAKAEHAKHRFEWRQARLAREEAQKQARRQARLAKQTSGQSTGAQSTSPQADLRSLRIAQTAAKAAVRKAEKNLARAAQQEPDQPHEDLEIQLATAQENLRAADAHLADARDASASQESP